MRRIGRQTVRGTILIAVLLGFACTADQFLGEYFVVDLDKSLNSITTLPVWLSKTTSLSEYREQLREKYSSKPLRFTSRPPHAFLIPVPLKGSVEGLLHGGWIRDQTNANTVLIYEWVSGSVYTLWGSATLAKNGFTVTLARSEPQVVLHFRKRN